MPVNTYTYRQFLFIQFHTMIKSVTFLLCLFSFLHVFSQDIINLPPDSAATKSTEVITPGQTTDSSMQTKTEVAPAAPEELDIMGMLNEEETKVNAPAPPTKSTFKGTYIINGPSVELIGPGELQFMFQHRFGTFENGAYDLWGMDEANIRLSFDYGLTRWLNIGVGRTNVNKVYDGNIKARIVRQQSGGSPVTLVAYGTINYNTFRWNNPEQDEPINRLAYSADLLIARKFSERISIQVSPTYVHRNLVSNSAANDVFTVGFAGRYKFSKRMALMLEYHLVPAGQNTSVYVPVASIGVDIETGGHVFQLHLSNTNYMNEYLFLTENTSKWSKNQFRMGFNVSRIFTVNSKAAQKDW